MAATTSSSFVGDGQYVGDGGARLQRLWEFVPWKMIRNCPGRYIVQSKRESSVLINGTPVTELSCQAFLYAALSEEDASTLNVHDLESERCKDNVQVVVFPDGGGVITYCKRQQLKTEEATTPTTIAATVAPATLPELIYVHTLNTASGLKRKLEGLQLADVLPSK